MNPLPFLNELAANNDRPWFQAHRDEYEQVRRAWIADIDRFIAACSQWEPAYARLSGADSIYRIYRDTRFSPDKTPYKTHMAAYLSPRGRRVNMAGVYIQAGGDMSGLYAGLWMPRSDELRKLRHAIVDNIEEFEEIISEPVFRSRFPEWCGPRLKTIPKGWPREHPQAELLRLLSFGVEYPVPDSFWDDPAWPEQAAALLAPTKPLLDFLNYSLFEE